MTTTTADKIADYAQEVVNGCTPRFFGDDARSRTVAEMWRSEIASEVRDAILRKFDTWSVIPSFAPPPPEEGLVCWPIEAAVLKQMRDELTAVMGTLSLLGVFAPAEVKAHLEDLSGRIERVRALTVPADALGAPARQGRRLPRPIDEIADAVRNAVMSATIPLPNLAVPIAEDAAWVSALRETIARAATAAVKRSAV